MPDQNGLVWWWVGPSWSRDLQIMGFQPKKVGKLYAQFALPYIEWKAFREMYFAKRDKPVLHATHDEPTDPCFCGGEGCDDERERRGNR